MLGRVTRGRGLPRPHADGTCGVTGLSNRVESGENAVVRSMVTWWIVSCLAAARAVLAADDGKAGTSARDALPAVRRSVGPFRLAGDLGEGAFDRIADGTVDACTRALRRQFFVKEPARPYTVYLMGDDRSYRGVAREITGRDPDTPFGFCVKARRVLVMNIATGTGTLVHEMVHALMAADFPGAPAWFEEGLASLYEQCRVEETRLVGLPNWRLPIVREAVGDPGRYVPIGELARMDDATFYGPGSPVHYAEARYLMFYLQEQGVLERFYRALRDAPARERDPGRLLATLLKVEDVDRVDADFRAWAMTVRR